MSSKRIAYLALAALLVIAISIWIATSRNSTTSTADALLYPQLKDSINAVNAVRIYKAGDQRSVEITHTDKGWSVSERAHYPADAVKVRKLLIDLQQARILEEKTSNPANYPALGVEDVSDKSARGVRLELAGIPQPVNLIIGKPSSASRATYMRRAGEKPSWEVNAELQGQPEPATWLQHDILDLPALRIQQAEISRGSATFSVAKKTRADENFVLSSIPKGTELNAPSAPNAVAGSLVALSLEDVATAAAFTEPPTEKATYKTFDGLIIDAQGWMKDGKSFVAFKPSFDASQAERFKDAGKSAANVSEEAQNLDKKIAGWVYQVPQYKYDAIFPKVDSWVKKK